MRRSTDGGRTFGPVVKIVDHATYGDGPASNFVMIPDRDTGRVVAMFFHDYARVFTIHSDDDGTSWSTPVEITPVFEQFLPEYPWRVCANGCGSGLRLRNGRMIVPVWLSDGSGSEFGPTHRGHRPSVLVSVYSDDRGRTWQRGDIVCRNGDVVEGITLLNPSETCAVELSDGRVMFNICHETKNHRRLVAVSPDGYSGWEGFRFDQSLMEPICMASLLRCDWPALLNYFRVTPGFAAKRKDLLPPSGPMLGTGDPVQGGRRTAACRALGADCRRFQGRQACAGEIPVSHLHGGLSALSQGFVWSGLPQPSRQGHGDDDGGRSLHPLLRGGASPAARVDRRLLQHPPRPRSTDSGLP
jgi:hypothetical protein